MNYLVNYPPSENDLVSEDLGIRFAALRPHVHFVYIMYIYPIVKHACLIQHYHYRDRNRSQ